VTYRAAAPHLALRATLAHRERGTRVPLSRRERAGPIALAMGGRGAAVLNLSAISARLALAFAAMSGLMAVAMGTVAAHILQGRIDAEALGWFDTGVRYQMWHAIALVGVAAFLARRQGRALGAAALAWMVGTVLFSGSLYVLALTGFRPVAMITPLGGIAFLIGWASLASYALRARLG